MDGIAVKLKIDIDTVYVTPIAWKDGVPERGEMKEMVLSFGDHVAMRDMVRACKGEAQAVLSEDDDFTAYSPFGEVVVRKGVWLLLAQNEDDAARVRAAGEDAPNG